MTIVQPGLRRQRELPRPPWEIAEEVELYARESGRHAKLHFAPGGGWVARFTLRPSDKRMRIYQELRTGKPPTEDVWFHRPKPGGRVGDFIPLDILEMGASGVRQFLERGNMWGRGEYRSLEEQLRQVTEENEEGRLKNRAKAKEANRYMQRDKRRWRFKIPFLPVGINLKAGTE